MMTTPTDGRIELRQSNLNKLTFPIFLGVVLIAIVVRQFFPSPNPVVLIACGVLAVVDVLFARWLLRNTGATLVIGLDAITYTQRGPAAPVVIERTPGATLSFRTVSNGPVGSKYTSYALKLRDNASGTEIPADPFGRRRIEHACDALGWTLS